MRVAIVGWLGLGLLMSIAWSPALWPAGPQDLATAASTQGEQPAPLVVPADLKRSEVEKFVAPLSDVQVRAVLIDELRSHAGEAGGSDGPVSYSFAEFLGSTRSTIAGLGRRLDALTEAWDGLPDTLDFMVLLLTDQEGIEAMGSGLSALLYMLLAGAIAAAVANRLCRQPRAYIANAVPSSVFLKLTFLAGLLVLDMVNVIVFALSGFALSFLFFADVSPMRLFAVTYLSVAAAAYFAYTVARFLFAPALQEMRIVPMSTQAARRNTAVFVVLASIMASGFFSGGFLEVIGADEDFLALLHLKILALFATVLIVHLLFAPALPAQEPALFRQWRWLAILYVVLVTGIWAMNVALGNEHAAHAAFLSIFLAMSVPALDRAVRNALANPVPAADVHGQPPPGAEVLPGAELKSNATIVLSIVRVAIAAGVVVAAFLLLIEAATGAISPWLSTPLGIAVAGAGVRVLVSVIIACTAWSVLRGFIDRMIARERAKAAAVAAAEGGEADGEGGSGIVGTRTQTLLPLFRGTVFVVITAVTIMIVLSAIGIDIGPLLAGAGVVGLAIGFGAQALVKDVVSGIFFLIDDAFRIGEYIEMEELRGEVEKISIRSMQLRHHRGSVQTIPFGEIKSITNYNRDWVIYKQEFRVPYETDLEKVRKLIKKLGQSMLAHPQYGQYFIEPLKSQGVRRIEDSALILGTKFMCKPRRQFVLRRHVYQQIQHLFHDNGIEFARKRVIVEGGDPNAATAALEEEEHTEQSVPDRR
ncbi:MAG: mechanosensitive ion channel [Gammaproteobacteria bacterium]|nr:mechanosensitive ion channel [Gammaproteobacteria bacterium]